MFSGNYWTLDPAYDNMFEKGNYRRRRRMKRPGPYRAPVSLPKPIFADSCALNQLLGPKYDQSYPGQGYGNYGSYFGTSAYSSWPPSLGSHSAAAAASAPLAGTGLGQLNSYAASCQRVPSLSSYYSQMSGHMPGFSGQASYTPSQVTLPDLSPSLSPSITGMSTGHTMGNGGPGGGSSSTAFSFTGCRQQDSAPSMPPYPYWSDRQQL